MKGFGFKDINPKSEAKVKSADLELLLLEGLRGTAEGDKDVHRSHLGRFW